MRLDLSSENWQFGADRDSLQAAVIVEKQTAAGWLAAAEGWSRPGAVGKAFIICQYRQSPLGPFYIPQGHIYFDRGVYFFFGCCSQPTHKT